MVNAMNVVGGVSTLLSSSETEIYLDLVIVEKNVSTLLSSSETIRRNLLQNIWLPSFHTTKFF